MNDVNVINSLKEIALKQRQLTIEMANLYGPLHVGGDLSAADILTVLFQQRMNIDPSNPDDPRRDRFVLSKGHAAAALYIAMALKGYFKIEDLLTSYMGFQSCFGLHPCKESLPALECTSGSLGHGLSLAVGMGLASKLDDIPNRIYCLIGDGELAEGSIWEAVMSAAQFELDNLIAIVDFNKLTLDGFTKDIMNVEPLPDKFRAFNWHVVEVNGNCIEELIEALEKCASDNSKKPHVIIANTIKGCGVSFMENDPLYHSASLTEEEKEIAFAQLDQNYREVVL